MKEIYDKLENLSQSPFISSVEQDGEREKVLDEVWQKYRADKVKKLEAAMDEGKENELDRVHKLITERGRVPVSGFIWSVYACDEVKGLTHGWKSAHPIAFMPLLLGLLGPNIVPVYKAALSGQRIVRLAFCFLQKTIILTKKWQLLYSQPPVLPLSALAWNIWALSLPPRAALANGETEISEYLGNVGLMDLDNIKAKKGGWVASKFPFSCVNKSTAMLSDT